VYDASAYSPKRAIQIRINHSGAATNTAGAPKQRAPRLPDKRRCCKIDWQQGLRLKNSACEILICLSAGTKAVRPLTTDGELKRGGVHTDGSSTGLAPVYFHPLYSLSQNTRSWPTTSPLKIGGHLRLLSLISSPCTTFY